MAFDPALPVNNSPVVAAELRSQFTGLRDLIDTIPVGPEGPPGETITNFAVTSVTTLPPEEPATATAGFDGVSVNFTFGIPSGAVGEAGPAFTNFVIGAVDTLPGDAAIVAASFDGTAVTLDFGIPRGADGPAFTNFIAGTVTTLDPGQPATVAANFDGTAMNLEFGIPRGEGGGFTQADLDAAIAGTALNPVGTGPLHLAVSNPPTQAEMQSLADSFDALIAALKRA